MKKALRTSLLAACCSWLVYSGGSLANDNLKISGFGTITAGLATDSEKPRGPYDGDVTFKPDSLMGVQLYYSYDDKISATLQLTSRGMTDFDTKIEWAYLTYIADRNWSFKLGKFRTPFFEYSQSVDIGYSYHWVKPPESVYIPLFSNLEGASVTHRGRIGKADSTLELFYGTLHETSPAGPVDLNYMVGGSWLYQYDWFSVRASYFKSEVTLPPIFAPAVLSILPSTDPMAPPPPGIPMVSPAVADAIIPFEEDTTFGGIAVKAEFDEWLFLAEYTFTDMDDSIFTNPKGSYVSVAYTMGDWQPHITYEWFDTEPQTQILDMVPTNDPVYPILSKIIAETSEDRTIATVGVRYNLNYATSLKLDYSYVDYDVEIPGPRPLVDAGLILFSANFVF